MSEVPNGWVSAKLKDVVELRTGPFGSSLHKSDYVDGGIPIVNPMHIEEGLIQPSSKHRVSEETAERLSEFRLSMGDVVLGRRGEMGRCAVVQANQAGWLCGTGSLIVRPGQGIAPDFLQGLLSSDAVVKHLSAESVGTTMVNLNQRILLDLDVLIPPSQEQIRIVEKLEELLSELAAGVAELKAAQRKLMQYRQSLLKAAVEGALTADWRAAHGKPQENGAELLQHILAERRTRWEQQQLAKFAEQGKTPSKGWQTKYLDPVAPDTDGLSALPEGWVWASVDQVGEVQLGKMLDKAKHRGGKPLSYLRNVNVRWGAIDVSDLLTMNFEEDELLRFGLQIGDVLVCEGGEPGRAAACGPEHLSLKYQKALHRVRLFDAYVPDLLVSYLEHAAKSGLLDRSFTGSTIQHFTRESFIELPIPLPPREEQVAIVATLTAEFDRIREMEHAIKLSLVQAAAQRKNILKSAFAGQLVPQDPNDEPASELLARIRAAREALGNKKTASKRGRKAKESA